MTIREKIESLKTQKNSWNKEALAELGVPWPPPKGWRKKLEGRPENKGCTVPMTEFPLELFTPSQVRQIKLGGVSDRVKRYWIVQNKAKEMTGKVYGNKAELRTAEGELNNQ